MYLSSSTETVGFISRGMTAKSNMKRIWDDKA